MVKEATPAEQESSGRLVVTVGQDPVATADLAGFGGGTDGGGRELDLDGVVRDADGVHGVVSWLGMDPAALRPPGFGVARGKLALIGLLVFYDLIPATGPNF